MKQQTHGTFDAFRPDHTDLEYLEYLLEHGDELDKPKIRRYIQAHKRHMKKCGNVDLEAVDPLCVMYQCRTCDERVSSSRYLVSALSMSESSRSKSGRLKKGVEVLDTFTSVWYGTDKDGTIPHDNRCHHCGQDMTCLDPEVAAETFDPKSPVG